MPIVMDADRIGRTLTRIAHEIDERNKGVQDLALVGVRRRGEHIAKRLASILKDITGHDIPTGALDITLYRDDVARQAAKPVVRRTEINFSIDARKILLVDDVLFTGRTTRAALDALFSHGRPRRVQMCVLIDRGHREIPVEATFVGRNVQTSMNEVIEVKLTEVDDAEKVLLMER